MSLIDTDGKLACVLPVVINLWESSQSHEGKCVRNGFLYYEFSHEFIIYNFEFCIYKYISFHGY
jgi:hypothetical protein